MVTDKIKQLEAAKAKLAQLEKSVAAGLQRELAGLPAAYGFDSLRAFIRAVTAASGGRKAGASAKGAKRRKRSVITDATRAQVKKLTEAGKTGAQIAKEVGISLPSVQNIKKALGLVKARK
ncbi:MAG TPA: helix-turn-helix domain-containing protein [Opitutaceae bacterium]|nr:helix-turn-helix domain-containing protein [Opitutaceae bacterium]